MNAQTNSISAQQTPQKFEAEKARIIESLRREKEEQNKEEKAREEALAKDAKGVAPDSADQKQELDDKKFEEKAQDDKERSFEEKRVADKQFEDKQFANRQFDDRKREEEKRQDQKAQDRQPEREEQRRVEAIEAPEKEKEKFTVEEEQKDAAQETQFEEKLEEQHQDQLERFAPRHREINRTGQETHSEMLSDRGNKMTFEGRDHPEFLSADRGAEGYKSKDELRGEMTQAKETQAKEMDQGKGKEASESTSAVSQRLDQRIEAAKANYVAAGSPQPSHKIREYGQQLSARLDQIEAQKAQQMTKTKEQEQTLTR